MAARLSEFLPPPYAVDLGGPVALPLHPITSKQIALLLTLYKDQVLAFFANNNGKEMTDFEQLVLLAPQMVAHLIALSARMDDIDQFEELGVGVQVELLGAVYKLSVPNEKKFVESLESLLQMFQRFNLERQNSQPPRSSTPSSESGSTSSSEQATALMTSLGTP